MLARLIATVAALLLACASPQADAHVRAERVSVSLADLADLATADRSALAAENASPAKAATNPKTAPPARAKLPEAASGKNAALTHCRVVENWSPLQKCASMPVVYQWDGTRLAGRTNATGSTLGDYQHAYGWAISSREGAIRSTLHTDVHGTPQLITDGTAAIAGWTRTDVWGVEKASTGQQSRLGHTGYLKDPLLQDELYAQARQYRAGVGRFTSRDEWAGDNLSPITLNRYLYGNGNPGSYLDPDGRCSVQLELGPCDLRRNAAFLSPEAAATQNRIADIADAKLAAKASPAATGISRSVVKNVKAGVQLFADAAYTIPEQMLPQSWDRGSRVRLGGAMEGLAGWAGSPYDTTQQQYAEGLDRAAELRASGRTFEADVAEWEAHTDLASMAFGAQQLLRSGAKYAGRQVDNYVGKLDLDAREIDAQMFADAAPRDRVIVERENGEPAASYTNPGPAARKPLNSPDIAKWLGKGGSVWAELDGTWAYKDWEGNTVRYPSGYPDFASAGLVRQSVEIKTVPDHNKDFQAADAAAPMGPKLGESTWHHHQDMKTMQEILRKIHDRFRHRGGVSEKKKINGV